MENPAPFDLSHAIQQWRERISSSPAVCKQDVNELEDHLRESIASLELGGLTPQEAFWIATRRLGSTERLEAEFGKVNRSNVWIDRVIWMVVGSLSFGFLASLTYSLANIANFSILLLTSRQNLGPLSLILHPLLVCVLLLLILRSANRSRAAITRLGRWSQKRPIAVVICVVALLAACQVVNAGIVALMTNNLTTEQLGAAMTWRFPASMILSLVTPMLLGWLLHRRRREDRAAAQL